MRLTIPVKKIIERYQDGESGPVIAYDAGCSKYTIYRILRRHHIKLREGRFQKRYTCKIPSKNLTPETQYWIGFILADGCIVEHQNTESTLQILLWRKDIKHLQKALRWLKCQKPIYKTSINCSIHIGSQKLIDFLNDFGIYPRKSRTVQVDNRLQNSKHFWRGVIDGDGSIHMRGNSPVIDLGGNKKVCQSFLNYCQHIGVDTTPNKPNHNGQSYKAVIQGKKAEKIICNLYHTNQISLDRKQQLANEVISHGKIIT